MFFRASLSVSELLSSELSLADSELRLMVPEVGMERGLDVSWGRCWLVLVLLVWG